MEFGAPASSSLRPVVAAVGPRPVASAADPTLRHVAPAVYPSVSPVAPATDTSLWPVTPTAGPSRRPVDHTAGPSWRPVDPIADPSRMPVNPTAGPSWRHMAPTAGPSRRPMSMGPRINVRISEQPVRKGPKFRYPKESHYPSPIPGASSTKDCKTFPAIEITNYTGKVNIVVSCVTKDEPYRPHPHKLEGRASCFRGLCVMTVDITPENRVVTFPNIGIQCVKREDIAASLTLRRKQNIDPFCTGFDHGTSTRDIDLHAVRLCFQVIPQSLEWYSAIVSDVIYNGQKTIPPLHIFKSSHVSGSVRGGTEVILLCEEMQTTDVIVTLHAVNGTAVWRAPAGCVNFHKKVAVAFTTPPYMDPTTQSPVTVYIQLQSRSTGDRSSSIPFTYVPDPDLDYIERKRKKPLQKSLMDQIDNTYAVWDAVKTESCEKVPSDSMATPTTTPLDPYEPVSNDISKQEPVSHETAYPQWDQNMPSTSHTDYNQEYPCPAAGQNLYNTHQEVQAPAFSEDPSTHNMPSTSHTSYTNQEFQCPAPSEDPSTHNMPSTSHTSYTNQDFQCPAPSEDPSTHNMPSTSHTSYTNQDFQCPAPSEDPSTHNIPSTSHASYNNQESQCPAPSEDSSTHNIPSTSHKNYTNQKFQCPTPSQDQSTHNIPSTSHTSYTNQEFQCPGPSQDQSTHNMPSTSHTSYTNQEFQCPGPSQDQSTHNMPSTSHTSYTNQEFQCPGPSQDPSTHNMPSTSHTSYTNQEFQCPVSCSMSV